MALSLRKRVTEVLTAPLAERGFAPSVTPYFARRRSGWQELLVADSLESSRTSFTVTYGLHVPCVSLATARLGLPAQPVAHVARYLANQRFYTPKPSQSLQSVVGTVLGDLDAEAEPWFAAVHSISDVADLFHATLGSSEFNARAVSIYALLLSAAGRDAEAQAWCQLAIAHLEAPVYSTGKRFSRVPSDGAKRVPRLPFDEQLLTLLREHLAGGCRLTMK